MFDCLGISCGDLTRMESIRSDPTAEVIVMTTAALSAATAFVNNLITFLWQRAPPPGVYSLQTALR